MHEKLRFTFVWLSKHPNISLLFNMLKKYVDELVWKEKNPQHKRTILTTKQFEKHT